LCSRGWTTAGGEHDHVAYLLRELGDEKRRSRLLLNELNRTRKQLELCNQRLARKRQR
jgi:hypothetical protein